MENQQVEEAMVNADAEKGEMVAVDVERDPVQIKPPKKGIFSIFRRESKRDRQLASLTMGYQELVGLMGSIRENLELQTKGQACLLSVLEHLPEAAEGLRKMGEAAGQQTAAMESVCARLDSAVQNDQQLAESLNRLNETLSRVNKPSQFVAALKIVFLAALLTALSAVLWFNLNDAAPQGVSQKIESLFAKPNEPVSPVVESAAVELPADEVPADAPSENVSEPEPLEM